MTRPKRHLPGQVVFTTRRCSQRQFLLGTETSNLVGYMFGRAILSSGCEVHAAIAMSNHIHYVYTDHTAERSRMMQQFHSNLARKRNKQLGRSENFWDSREPGDCALLDVETVLQKCLYTALNAVAAGVVDRVRDWTGFKILPSDWGKTLRFYRPDGCGRDMPEFVEFVPQPPPGFAHLGIEKARQIFEAKITELERQYRQKRGTKMNTKDPNNSSNFGTSSDTEMRTRTLNPRFSCSHERRAAQAIIAERRFQELYLVCLEATRRGESVAFPSGTVRMAKIFNVECQAVAKGDAHLINILYPLKPANDNQRRSTSKTAGEEIEAQPNDISNDRDNEDAKIPDPKVPHSRGLEAKE